MICSAETKEVNQISTTNILPQTSFWARVKDKQGFIPTGFQLTVSKDILREVSQVDKDGQEDLLILIKYLSSDRCFAYVPYGPKLEPKFENQGIFLESLSEILKPHLPSNCVFIRYDLAWENQWAVEDEYYDEDGHWMGPPSTQTQEFRLNFSTEHWNLKKSPNDSLPKNTFFLPLPKEEKDLLYAMRYNTRYNIRQAFKKGVEVKEYGVEMLDKWYELFSETAARNEMSILGKDYFRNLLTHQDNEKDGVKVSLLMAEYEGEFLAAMFLVLSHKRGTYLFGASSTDKKHLRASYALQWEALKIAKDYGCQEYDMFGCAPNLDRSHPLHGVHLYKKGFGGQLFHRMGCWDYPFMQKDYELYKAKEMNG